MNGNEAAGAPDRRRDGGARLLRSEFLLDPDVVFLNHGSFGACPAPVFEAYQAWQRELEREPVDFIGRRSFALLAEARGRLARYVGCGAADLVYVPNATYGVNVVTHSLTVARSGGLGPGDEILTTDHEYGACARAWRRACSLTGAAYVPVRIAPPQDQCLVSHSLTRLPVEVHPYLHLRCVKLRMRRTSISVLESLTNHV